MKNPLRSHGTAARAVKGGIRPIRIFIPQHPNQLRLPVFKLEMVQKSQTGYSIDMLRVRLPHEQDHGSVIRKSKGFKTKVEVVRIIVNSHSAGVGISPHAGYQRCPTEIKALIEKIAIRITSSPLLHQRRMPDGGMA